MANGGKFSPPCGREHPPAAGAHSPGMVSTSDMNAGPKGSQPATRTQTGPKAPVKR
jgi:hypothetical protein